MSKSTSKQYSDIDPPLLIMNYPHPGGWHNTRYVPEYKLQEVAERAALYTLEFRHNCRLKKTERGIPAGTPCDTCIDDSKWIAEHVLDSYRGQEEK